MPTYDQLVEKGNVLLKQKRHREALRCFEEAADLDPRSPAAFLGLGMAYKHLRMVGKAISHHRQAVERDGTHLVARLNLGGLLYEIGQFREAEEHLNYVVSSAQWQRTVAADNASGGELGGGRAQARHLAAARSEIQGMLHTVRMHQRFAASELTAREVEALTDRAAGVSFTQRKIRIGLLTCLWKRSHLSDFVLGYYDRARRHLADAFTLALYAVGSEGGASRSLAQQNGFRYVEHPNRPLGAKWNAGLQAMAHDDLDAVLIVGSDDLLGHSYLRIVAAGVEQGYALMGLKDMYVFELATLRLCYWPGYEMASYRAGEPVGMGRCIHRSLLDRVDWRLWEDALNNSLDGSMMRRLAPLLGSETSPHAIGICACRPHGLTAVDVKTDQNIWSFDRMIGWLDGIDYVPPASFFTEQLSRHEAAGLFALSSEAALLTELAREGAAAGTPSGEEIHSLRSDPPQLDEIDVREGPGKSVV